MMLLAVDTSTAQMGLALYNGAQVLAESLWITRQHHTVELAPALAELLARGGLAVDEVGALGVALGPGSFTSLRVGLAFAKGLALARHVPIIGIPTLDIVAAAQPASRLPLVVVLQAGRSRLAVGWYKRTRSGWRSEGPARVATADSLADEIERPTLVAGELSADDRQRLVRKRVNVVLVSPAQSVRRPAILAELAWKSWQAGQSDEVASLAPMYLHVSDSLPA